MAPQLEYDEKGTTFYGAVEITPPLEERKTSRSNTLKLLVGMAFIAVGMTAAVFAFTSPAPSAVVSVADVSVPICECASACVDTPGYEKSGVCEVSADCADFKGGQSAKCTADELKSLGLTGTKKCAQCEHVVGVNQCTPSTCKNGGVCLDRFWDPKVTDPADPADRGYECKCPRGYRGKNCESVVNVCADWKANGPRKFCNNGRMDVTCSSDADCKFIFQADKDVPSKCTVTSKAPCVHMDNCKDTAPGKYTCQCNAGFDGDGYQPDQCNVFYGSVLSKQCNDGGGKSAMFQYVREFDRAAKKATDVTLTLLNKCPANLPALNSAFGWVQRGCEAAGANKGKNKMAGCYDHDDCVVPKGSAPRCLHGGTCTDNAEFVGKFKCTCVEKKWKGDAKMPVTHWNGDTCDNNVNACDVIKGYGAEKACGPHAKCDDLEQDDQGKGKAALGTPAQFKDGLKCTCLTGYEFVKQKDGSFKCEDIDDCVKDPKTLKARKNPCSHGGKCTNHAPQPKHKFNPKFSKATNKRIKEGTYTCDCTTTTFNGFQGKENCRDGLNNKECFDCDKSKDECTETNPWKHTCTGKNERCIEQNPDKHNRPFHCMCKSGFVWASAYAAGKVGSVAQAHEKANDSDNCIDYNDCDDGHCGGSSGNNGQCIDTKKQINGWMCKCNTGWRASKVVDGKDVDCDRDIDECRTFNRVGHVCHNHASCINTPGSWDCKCDQGYSGDGEIMCDPVDDCVRYDYGKQSAFCKTDMTDCTKMNADGSMTTDASLCKDAKGAKHTGQCVFATNKNKIWRDQWKCAPGPNGDLGCKNAHKNHINKINDGLQKEWDAAKRPGSPSFRTMLSGGKWQCDPTKKVCLFETPKTLRTRTACTKAKQADANKECNDDANLKLLGYQDGKWTCDMEIAKDVCTKDTKFALDFSPREFAKGTKTPVYSPKTKFIPKASWLNVVKVAADVVAEPVTLSMCKVHSDCPDTLKVAKGDSMKWGCNSRGSCEFKVKCSTDADCKASAAQTALAKVRDSVPTLKAAKLTGFRCGAKNMCVLTKAANVHQCGLFEKTCTKPNCSPKVPFDTFHSNGRCVDRGFNAYECQCEAGWTDSNCDRDVNECHAGTHECHREAECANIVGGYECKCKYGYQDDIAACREDPKLPGCGRGCHDIDDCTKHTPGKEKCVHGTACTDLGIDSYKCTCAEGWEDVDCDVDINECGMGSHECHSRALCINTEGSYECKCNLGFTGSGIKADPRASVKNPKASGCTLVDDCVESPCEHGECVDDGFNAYHCVCEKGWQDKNCDANVNECFDKTKYGVDCHEHGRCVDTPGSFYCRCVSGMAGDGYTCTDLDDCDPNPCGELAGRQCKGVPSSYTYGGKAFPVTRKFACGGRVPSGMHKNEESTGCFDMGANRYKCNCCAGWGGPSCCTDVNECTAGTHDCGSVGGVGKGGALCVNTPGSFKCECLPEHWDPCIPQKDGTFKTSTGEACRPGRTCNKCNKCNTEVPGATYNCPIDGKTGLGNTRADQKLRDTLRGKLIYPWEPSYVQSPPASVVTRGKGFRQKAGTKGCHKFHQDFICENVDECAGSPCEAQKNDNSGTNYKTECVDTCGSYQCRCAGHISEDKCFWQKDGNEFASKGKAAGNSGCIPCTKCQVGEYMVRQATPSLDRVCRRLVPDGPYVIESQAGSISQCLVNWRQENKVYPERYNWGGKSRDESVMASENLMGKKEANMDATQLQKLRSAQGKVAADVCKNPICGVCPWNGMSAAKDILKSGEAAWTFRRIKDHKYIIMTRSGSKGMRCLGFENVQSPYPQAVWYKTKSVKANEGRCGYGKCKGTSTKCTSSRNCGGRTCVFDRCSRSGDQGCKLFLCVKANKVLDGVSSYAAACPAGYEAKKAAGSGVCEGGAKTGEYCTKDGDCPTGFCHNVGTCTLSGAVTEGSWSTSAANTDPLPSTTTCAKHNHPACYCGRSSVDTLLEAPGPQDASVVWDVKPLGCVKTKLGGCSKRTSPGMYIIAQENRKTKKFECLYFPDQQARTYSNPQRTPRRVTQLMKELNGMKGHAYFQGSDNASRANWCGIKPKAGQTVDEALLENKAAVFKLVRLDANEKMQSEINV